MKPSEDPSASYGSSTAPSAHALRRSADGALIAAVDLGSNSFHMSVARIVAGLPHVVDRLRSQVALAAGLDAQHRLSAEACERALACIERFGQRLRDLPPENVRAVGTSAMRQARNLEPFLARAQELLGHEIEIISGHEEARLIYLGVAHDLADDEGRRLVIDIGGGSTECIVGEEFETIRTDSLHIGCIQTSLTHFPGGRVTAKGFERAEVAARLEIRPVERLYRALGWENCVGSSGTILAIDTILRENDWARGGIHLKGLRKLKKALVAAGDIQGLELRGLQAERKAVLPGGLAILISFFTALEIDVMKTSTSALRDGLLYDLLGRIRHEDVRDRTIRNLAERYHVDREQASRVSRTAAQLFDEVAEPWRLLAADRQLLRWAAELHEIGLSIAFSGQHAHGAYIIEHTDMPGFSRDDQRQLAALVLSHRRKLARERIAPLVPHELERVLLCAVLLRVAVVLNRSRSPGRVPIEEARAERGRLALRFAGGWLDHNPLTREDLLQERQRLTAVGIELEVLQEASGE